MTQYHTNQLKNGMRILIEKEPYSVLDTTFVNPGKGQAFTRVKMRNLCNNRVLEKTFKSGESIASADIQSRTMQYLYNDSVFWHFMDPENFEQRALSKDMVGDQAQWLKEQDPCEFLLWNDEVISLSAPSFVNMEVTQADPGVKGDTAQGGSKSVTLQSGATVRVPLFIEAGEIIRVDTRSGSYIGRAKEGT